MSSFPVAAEGPGMLSPSHHRPGTTALFVMNVLLFAFFNFSQISFVTARFLVARAATRAVSVTGRLCLAKYSFLCDGGQNHEFETANPQLSTTIGSWRKVGDGEPSIFGVPLYVGLGIMDWANSRSEEKWKDAVAGKTRKMGTVTLPDMEERRKAAEDLAAFVKSQHEKGK